MTEEQFRIGYSTLMEHYQYIEMHLEGIYACVSGRSFFDTLEDVSSFSLTKLVKDLEKIDAERWARALSASDYARLETIYRKRNHWVHNAFTDISFNEKTGEVEQQKDAEALEKDMADARLMRDYLFVRKLGLMEEKKRDIAREISRKKQ